MSKTKCLVTGGNGFLGRWIVEDLIKRTDYHITILDIFIPANAAPTDRITYIAGDITDAVAVRNALKGHHICMHVASPPHHFPAEKFKKINIEGTQNVIDGCLQEGVSRLIYTSSASVLQDGGPLENADETLPYPKTFIETYSETKAIAEEMILKANNNSSLLTCSLRPSGIFGPGDTQATPGFMEVLKKGQHRLQIGDNSGLFDWTYVENVAYSHVLAAEKLVAGSGVPGQAFFITNGAPVPFWNHPRALYAEKGVVAPRIIIINFQIALIIGFLSEMFSLLKKMMGKEAKEGFTRVRVRYISYNRYFNINKARTLLGYEPVVVYKDGVKKTMAHFMALEELEAKKKA
ncbi:erg26, C-3 sterol dehydrogenase [Mortierella hygrophila]|uniref:Erg26, C-3 sterol dehydrogenase n=1 Tax=Mortierella hygrophila TaxID=979708 RepID=A0A9P6K8Q9_9FUNG|nr:erg26, C-3 sterol dehydrogenase [Mortierella hygrophila]